MADFSGHVRKPRQKATSEGVRSDRLLRWRGAPQEVNVLDEVHNPGLRETLKTFSHWPTIPQVPPLPPAPSRSPPPRQRGAHRSRLAERPGRGGSRQEVWGFCGRCIVGACIVGRDAAASTEVARAGHLGVAAAGCQPPG